MEWFTYIKGLSGIILFYITGVIVIRVIIALLIGIMEKFYNKFEDSAEDKYFSALDRDMGVNIKY